MSKTVEEVFEIIKHQLSEKGISRSRELILEKLHEVQIEFCEPVQRTKVLDVQHVGVRHYINISGISYSKISDVSDETGSFLYKRCTDIGEMARMRMSEEYSCNSYWVLLGGDNKIELNIGNHAIVHEKVSIHYVEPHTQSYHYSPSERHEEDFVCQDNKIEHIIKMVVAEMIKNP